MAMSIEESDCKAAARYIGVAGYLPSTGRFTLKSITCAAFLVSEFWLVAETIARNNEAGAMPKLQVTE